MNPIFIRHSYGYVNASEIVMKQPRTTPDYCHDARRSLAYPGGCVNLAAGDCAHCGKLFCPDHLQIIKAHPWQPVGSTSAVPGLFCDACASWIRSTASINQMQADYFQAMMMLAEISGPICDAATVHLKHVLAHLASIERYTIGKRRDGTPWSSPAEDRIENAQLRDRKYGEGPPYRSTVEDALGPGPWPTKREGQ